jgi:hypothetical protein
LTAVDDNVVTTSVSDGTLRAFGKCLDVADGATANRTQVQLFACNSTPAQQWTYNPSSGALVNPLSGRCTDVPDGIAEDGKQLQIYDCNVTASQRWTLPI